MDTPVFDLDVEIYRVSQGNSANLGVRPTRVDTSTQTVAQRSAQMVNHLERLSRNQDMFHASNRNALLVIIQGMDAAGKDGTIAHVMAGVNPQGCDVFSFKHPSQEELQHDFLWRTSRDLPERGKIGIFNRSYYEEVLILRVHPELLQGEGLQELTAQGESIWEKRYRSINALEQHLYENGTRVLKFFLHLSREEQLKRFLERIDNPNKNWKLSRADVEERNCWGEYVTAYEECLNATSTNQAPWYVVPADEKDLSRLIISQVLVNFFEGLGLSYPKSTPERRLELAEIRAQLVASRSGNGYEQAAAALI